MSPLVKVVHGDCSESYRLGSWEWVMRVDPAVRKCVVFIGYVENGKTHLKGTAFLSEFDATRRLLVTAGHIINGIRHFAPKADVSIWFNHDTKGIQRIDTDPGDWLVGAPDDPMIDVAVYRSPVPCFDWDHYFVPQETFVSDQFVREYMIDVGDDLYFPGLFAFHHGRERLRPIVRQGTIAAMPEETVRTKLGRVKAYLAEVRSIGGLSGSPVWFHKDLLRVPHGATDEEFAAWQAKFGHSGEIPEGFFGMVIGHFDTEEVPTDWVGYEALNMGICLIVPAELVKKVVYQTEIEEMRKKAKEEEEPAAVLDSTDAVADFHHIGFEGPTGDLLNKLTQVPKSEADEVHRGHQE